MEFVIYEELDSTQKFLLERAQENLCVVALRQSAGVGSRGNVWEGVQSGLYFSFCLSVSALPSDLALQSASIFFGYLFKELLCERGFEVFLKWPNDLYGSGGKLGGVMVSLRQEKLVCGIGLNFKSPKYGSLGVELERVELLKSFFAKIAKTTSWKQIFSKYKLEFYANLDWNFHHQEGKISLQEVQLLDDGAILHDGKIIYSSR